MLESNSPATDLDAVYKSLPVSSSCSPTTNQRFDDASAPRKPPFRRRSSARAANYRTRVPRQQLQASTVIGVLTRPWLSDNKCDDFSAYRPSHRILDGRAVAWEVSLLNAGVRGLSPEFVVLSLDDENACSSGVHAEQWGNGRCISLEKVRGLFLLV